MATAPATTGSCVGANRKLSRATRTAVCILTGEDIRPMRSGLQRGLPPTCTWQAISLTRDRLNSNRGWPREGGHYFTVQLHAGDTGKARRQPRDAGRRPGLYRRSVGGKASRVLVCLRHTRWLQAVGRRLAVSVAAMALAISSRAALRSS